MRRWEGGRPPAGACRRAGGCGGHEARKGPWSGEVLSRAGSSAESHDGGTLDCTRERRQCTHTINTLHSRIAAFHTMNSWCREANAGWRARGWTGRPGAERPAWPDRPTAYAVPDHSAAAMVDPGHTARGVGRALGEYVPEQPRLDGCNGMVFNSVVETNPAVRLWTSLGFRIPGTLPNAYEHPEHGLVGLHVMCRESRLPRDVWPARTHPRRVGGIVRAGWAAPVPLGDRPGVRPERGAHPRGGRWRARVRRPARPRRPRHRPGEPRGGVGRGDRTR